MRLGTPQVGAEHRRGERHDPAAWAVHQALVDQVSNERLDLVVLEVRFIYELFDGRGLATERGDRVRYRPLTWSSALISSFEEQVVQVALLLTSGSESLAGGLRFPAESNRVNCDTGLACQVQQQPPVR